MEGKHTIDYNAASRSYSYSLSSKCALPGAQKKRRPRQGRALENVGGPCLPAIDQNL